MLFRSLAISYHGRRARGGMGALRVPPWRAMPSPLLRLVRAQLSYTCMLLILGSPCAVAGTRNLSRRKTRVTVVPPKLVHLVHVVDAGGRDVEWATVHETCSVAIPSAAHRHCPASLAGWITRYFAGASHTETGEGFTSCSTSPLPAGEGTKPEAQDKKPTPEIAALYRQSKRICGGPWGSPGSGAFP